jgi:hypothetical protein
MGKQAAKRLQIVYSSFNPRIPYLDLIGDISSQAQNLE